MCAWQSKFTDHIAAFAIVLSWLWFWSVIFCCCWMFLRLKHGFPSILLYCLLLLYNIYHVSFHSVQIEHIRILSTLNKNYTPWKICAHDKFQLFVVLHHVLHSHSLWRKNSIKRNNAREKFFSTAPHCILVLAFI